MPKMQQKTFVGRAPPGPVGDGLRPDPLGILERSPKKDLLATIKGSTSNGTEKVAYGLSIGTKLADLG